MKKILYWGSLLFVVMSVTGSALAQNLIIYPAKGQSQEQMEKDKFECYSWAKQQTGVDPMVASTASQQPATSQGGAVKGAAKGALVGVGIGAIAGDAGKGAAIGAASGGAFGGLRSRSQRKQAEQVQKQQVSQMNQKINEYNRAYSACLEAKGYTVK